MRTARQLHAFAADKATIMRLLRERHAHDVFVEECKTGSTWMSDHRRLDAWACRASWTQPLKTGYEVKVSRSDWKSDDKWPDYLAVCDRLYFVCPYGMIDPEEVDPRAGLIWAKNTHLATRRAAPVRAVEWPADLLAYIVLCRSKVTRRPQVGKLAEWRPDAAAWSDWLAEKRGSIALGREVGRRFYERIERARREGAAEAPR